MMEQGQAQAQEIVTAPENNTTNGENAISQDNTTPDDNTISGSNTDLNCDNVLDSTTIESYLISSLKNLREENKRLAEQYQQLQNSYDVKMQEKLKSLNKINIQARSHIRPLLKQIQVRQLAVLHQIKLMIDNEIQIGRAYDKHCKATIEKTEKRHNLEKTQGYDEFTNMTSDQLTDVIKSFKEKIDLYEAEAMRLTFQMETEEENHKDELISLRNSVNTLDDVLRETSQMVQELQFEKTLRGQGSTPM